MSVLCAIYRYQDRNEDKDFLVRYFKKCRSTPSCPDPAFYMDDSLIIGVVKRNDSSSPGRVALEQEFFTCDRPYKMVISGCGEILPSSSGINNLAQLCVDYQKRGTDVLSDVNGQWIIIIWDQAARKLILARDPIGVSKIYYQWVGSKLYVSNTLQFFRQLNYTFDPDSIADFLRLVYIPSPKTIYKGVNSILPGSAISVDEDKFEEIEYKLPNYKTIFAKPLGRPIRQEDLDTELDRFHHYLKKAIRHSVGERQNAALLLSGGKDSSALAVAAAGFSDLQTSAIHIESNNADVDESRSAELVARHLHMPYRRYCFDPREYYHGFFDIIAGMDQPYGDPTCYPVFLLLKRIHRDYDVILDGTGNDGYFGLPLSPKDRKIYAFRRKAPAWLQNFFRLGLQRFDSSRYANVLAKSSGPLYDLFTGWHGWSYNEIERLLGYDRNEETTRLHQISLQLKNEDPTVLKTAISSGNWVPENVYRRSADAAKYFGMQARFPFLDIDLMKYVVSLPTELKLQRAVNKVLLREYMRRHLPDSIVHKPKGYFIYDTNALLAYNDFQLIKETLNEGELQREGIFNPAVVAPAVKAYREGNTAVSKKLFAILLLRCWLQIQK